MFASTSSADRPKRSSFQKSTASSLPRRAGVHQALEAGPVVPGAGARLLDVEDDLAAEPGGGGVKLVAGEAGVLVEGGDAVVDGDAQAARGSHRDGVREGVPSHQPMTMGPTP